MRIDIHFSLFCVSKCWEMQHIILSYMHISNEKSTRDDEHLTKRLSYVE